MQDQISVWTIRTPTAGITTVAGTPITAIQYVASATNTAELMFFSITQSSTTTSLMDQVRVVRKTVAATLTNAGAVGTNLGGVFDQTGNSTNGASTFRGTLSTSGTGNIATAEGTDGDEIYRANFNLLSGYEKDFQPNARIWVPSSGIIAIKIKAVVAQTYDVTMTIREQR